MLHLLFFLLLVSSCHIPSSASQGQAEFVLLNDFNAYEMSPPQDSPAESLAVLVQWIGHTHATPQEILERAASLIDWAIERKMPVVRWDLHCARTHNINLSVPEEGPVDSKKDGIDVEGGLDDADGDGSEDIEEEEDLPAVRTKRWHECSSLVKLHCEVYPDDLTTVHIWQQCDNPDVPLNDRQEGLRYPRLQCNLFLENFRLHGVKVSSLVRETQRTPYLVLGRTTPLPPWREPTLEQLSSLYIAIKHRQLLDRNSWRATHLLVQCNKEKIFMYQLHDFERPDSESPFTVGLTDDYSLDNGIVYAEDRGLGSDQCWWTKSQNRTAMSLLYSGHMVPNPSVISTRNRSPEIVAKIIANAESIVEDGWRMAHLMIDKHWPSLLALKDFIQKYGLTSVFIHICQFHVVYAIMRWEWENGRKGLALTIGMDLKYQIIFFFWSVQRARTLDQFEQLKVRFLEDLKALIVGDEDEISDATEASSKLSQTAKGKLKVKAGGPQQGKVKTLQVRRDMYDSISDYFEKNWFINSWIEHYTDIGMPPDQSWDSTWNTNNWSESAFKTFDSIFLQNRQNKRIDRLASIILNDFLPYYQYWRPRDHKPSQDVLDRHFEAHTLWDRGSVREVEPDVYMVEGQASAHIPCDHESDGLPMRQLRPIWKACLHILIAELLRSNGPVERWKDVEAESERLAKKKPGTAKRSKVTSDTIEQEEFNKVLDRLEAADAALCLAAGSPEPSFEPTARGSTGELAAMGQQSGRPPNSTQLHPSRSGIPDPRFSCPPGHLPAGQLAPGSLFLASVKGFLRPERGNLGDGHLWGEEEEMATPRVCRWVPLSYTMRTEEGAMWTAMFNNCEIAQCDGWWFVCCSPVCITPDVIAGLDWSTEITVDESSSSTEPWSAININNQATLCAYLNDRHPLVNSAGQAIVKRSDGSTCGFWSVFTVFSKLLQIDLKRLIVRDMDHDPADLKEVVAPVHSAFLADPLFQKFEPAFDYVSLTGVCFSERLVSMAHATENPMLALPPGPPPTRNESGPLTLDSGVAHLVDTALGDVSWLIGPHLPSRNNIQDLLDGKELHNVVLDAYLDLFVQDLLHSETMYPRFMVPDSIVGHELQTQNKNASNIEGMRLKTSSNCNERHYWFEQDIFALKWLILPCVDFNTPGIYMHDSYKSRGRKLRSLAATQRVHQMLRYEHLTRTKQPLGPEWSSDLHLTLISAAPQCEVPQQGETLNCGIYTVWFAKNLARGSGTNISAWKFMTQDANQEWLHVANRLSAAIHADMQERNVRQFKQLGIEPLVILNPFDEKNGVNCDGGTSPSLVTGVSDTDVMLHWFEGIKGGPPAALPAVIVISQEIWAEAVAQSVTPDKVLDDQLCLWMPAIVALYSQQTEPPTDVLGGSTLDSGPATNQRCSTGIFWVLLQEMSRSVPPMKLTSCTMRNSQRKWLRGTARTMLATAAASHYLKCLVYQPEQVWAAYGYALFEQHLHAGYNIVAELQISTPGLDIPPPCV
ncbi:hypothetical protein B0H10DRAFT_1954814 [Mycena sp. CBHHK59/15]|nr:hypothetical protein B0H10DRAFT_1954814 [Mycena sp. CBHHK59/15]